MVRARRTQGLATCPITENGLVRIVGHPKYPNSPGPPSAVIASLAAIRSLQGHAFWPDKLSLAQVRFFAAELLNSQARVTDSYLLALAHAHGGKLATMDRRLATEVVPQGRSALEII